MSELLARPPGMPGQLSAELSQLLDDAEERVLAQEREEIVLSPEEEIEAVLPADVLEALDEPLEEDPSDVLQFSIHPSRKDSSVPGDGARRTGTDGLGLDPTDGGGSEGGRVTTGARMPTRERDTGDRVPTSEFVSSLPPRVDSTLDPTPLPSRALFRQSNRPIAIQSSMPPPTEALLQVEVRPVGPSVVLGGGGAAGYLAEAVSARKSACLAFEADGGTRRVILADGDFVSASSSFEHESLSAFLVEQGEIPRFSLGRLVGKVPAFGRHAGAALVAHGYLAQDRLWPVLRQHAEWLVSRILLLESATLTEEQEPPLRLKNEHSVFGATTGAEVFVDVVRRVIPPERAIALLGGDGAHLAEGRRPALLAECGLDPNEERTIVAARGATVRDLLKAFGSDEILPVTYALRLLGVLETLAAIGGTDVSADLDVHGSTDAELEAEAVEARVRARLALVEEGDYFAVLGVARNATGYEIRRSFLELRRSFEPSRLLRRETAHLASDVRHIVVVLEEAYDVLRDAARRERYRRAIEVTPGG